MPEPPYGIISNQLLRGQVVPFLGAGASLSGRPREARWDERAAAFLPTGRELADALAAESEFPSPDAFEREDLAKVASYYQESSDRQGLVDRLRQVFDRNYQIGAVHQFLADVPVPLLIVTTNYDDLIERAFAAKGKPYHLVVHASDRADVAASVLWWQPGAAEPLAYPPAKLPLSPGETAIIYKMHGSIDRAQRRWDSFVITEEDYVGFLARMTGQYAIPARFMLYFRQSRFLFLGYGLRDWNLRVMLKSLRRAPAAEGGEEAPGTEDEGLRSWAIQHGPSVLEQMLWQSRRVNIYDLDIDNFVARMRERAGLP